MFARTIVRIVACSLVLAGAAFGQKADRVDYSGHKVVNVTMPTPNDVATMLAISEDHWSEGIGVGTFPFRVPPERMVDLENSGLAFEVVHDNVQALIEAEQPALGLRAAWFDAYKTYAEINAYIDTLVALRPDLVTKLTIGQSLEGRTVFGMKITSAVGGASKPAVFFNGCQHAREWISPMTNMYIADRLVQGYGSAPDATTILDEIIVYIIPIVNPDGYSYTWTNQRLWRKNRRNNGDGTFGVDLNRNWPFAWGGAGSSGSTSSETYRGTSAASEPEVQIVVAFVDQHPEIVCHIDFHSYSQLILYPYGHMNNPPPPPEPDLTRMVNLSADMAGAIFNVHGQVYVDQMSWELYPAAGTFPDWTYDAYGIYGWTIELRPAGSPGFLLPAAEIIPTGEENFEAIKVLTSYAALQLDFTFPSGLPSIVTPLTPTVVPVNIDQISATLAAGSEKLFTRIGASGPFTQSALTPLGGSAYQGTLPAAPCGDAIEYYFQAQTAGGATLSSPADAPTSVYSVSALETTIEFSDEMEADLGWTVGVPGDTATTGIWNRMDPEATAAQPENDHTPSGTNCWVTDGFAGASLGANDVDGGKTTLLTPLLDLSGSGAPLISYWRWYSNDTGSTPNSDVFTIDISADNGGSWVTVETVGPGGVEASGGWYYHEFSVTDFATPTAQTLVRFVAEDAGAGSIVEAAIDDFQVTGTGCAAGPCPADTNGDNLVDLTDLAVVLAHFGQTGVTLAEGDVDGDGDVDLTDLAEVLAHFGASCP